jgi:enoyl-[acyl-carrier protein] reductase I
MSLLAGTRGLVVGIANERSLAWGIAKAAREQGATLAITYQNDKLEKRVTPLAAQVQAPIVLPCELTSDADVARLAEALTREWGSLDFVVHAVATAKREELQGRFVDTTREGFAMALDVSVYSLVALARACEPLLVHSEHAPSLLTLSYLGAEKVVPNYNVMGVAKAALESTVRYLAADLGPRGVRVNAISAGPVRTLSAAGISGLRDMLACVEAQAPLRRNIDIDDVGRAAVPLLSALGRGVTGEIVHVDSGFHVLPGGAWARSPDPATKDA